MSDILRSFVDGIIGAPESLANGMISTIKMVGFSEASQKNREDFSNFISFLRRVPFDNAVGNIAAIVVPYILSEHQDYLAQKASYVTGSAITKKALVQQCIKNVTTAASKAATGTAASMGARSILAVFTMADLAGRSGEAADRLRREFPELAKYLEDENLIGGYFLIEDAINNMRDNASGT